MVMSDESDLSNRYSPIERSFAAQLLEDGLHLPTCTVCSTRLFPVRSHCPNCHSTEWTYPATDGVGRVVGYTVVRAPSDARFDAPITSALVELDAGPTVIGAVEGEPGNISVGDAVAFSEATVVHGHVRLSFVRQE